MAPSIACYDSARDEPTENTRPTLNVSLSEQRSNQFWPFMTLAPHVFSMHLRLAAGEHALPQTVFPPAEPEQAWDRWGVLNCNHHETRHKIRSCLQCERTKFAWHRGCSELDGSVRVTATVVWRIGCSKQRNTNHSNHSQLYEARDPEGTTPEA